ncbi:hypothetical protein ABZ114_03200 [Streptomyces albidoflavus]|uniref:hypothetical protein n=1 Tax=Streptomyces albidoflavus TaxID=1886 RepID=UPI0033A1A595
MLGKRHGREERLTKDVRALFSAYRYRSDLGSKPAAHLAALAALNDQQSLDNLPDVLARLVDYVRTNLAELPE